MTARVLLLPTIVLLCPAPVFAAPPDGDARARGESALSRGDWSRAVTELTGAIEHGPRDARAYFLRACARAERGYAWGNRADADRALADATRTLELAPDLAEAHACVGLARSLRCEHDAALAACDRAVKRAPTSPLARRYRALVLWRNDHLDRAVADCSEAIERGPRDVRAYLSRADFQRLRGDRDKALVDAKKAVELAPDAPAPYAARSAVRLARREYEAALVDAQKAVELAPHDPLARLAVADIYLVRREYAKARAAIDRALELAPGSAVAHADRANCHVEMGQPDLALADCRRALRCDPCSQYAHRMAADALGSKTEAARATAACDDAIRLYPNSAELLAGRADARAAAGDKAGAAVDLIAALKLDPRLARALMSQAEAHYLDQRYEEALAALDRALAVDPEYDMALGYRSACLERLGRADEAEKSFAAAVRFDLPNAYTDRGWARLTSGDTDGGFADLDRAIRERPDAPGLLIFRAWQRLYTSKDVTKAMADAERAVRIAPESSDAYFTRAQCRDTKGDTDGAIADLTRALTIDPSFVAARSLRATILMDKQQNLEALDDCDAALALDPNDAGALATRASLFAFLTNDGSRNTGPVGGAGGTPTGPRPAVFAPHAVVTSGGVRIRNAEPAWLAGPEDNRARAAEVVARLQTTSPDGRFVAVANETSGAVSVFASRTGSRLCEVAGHAFGTAALAFSPDGQRLATAGRDDAIRVWDSHSGAELLCVACGEWPTSVAWSHNGKQLLSGHAHPGMRGSVRLWDAGAGAVGAPLLSHASAPILAVAVLPNGDVAANGDGNFAVYDAAGRKRSERHTGVQVSGLRVSPDGALVVSGAGSVGVWAVRNGALADAAASATVGEGASVSADARRVVAFDDGGAIRQCRRPLTFEQAVADATRAARLAPEWDEPLVARGLCYFATDRFGHAKADFTRAIELNEKNPASYYYRALVLVQADDADGALTDFSAVIGLDPGDAESHLQRGLLYLKKGEYRKAKQDLDRAIELDPKLKSRLPADK